MDEDGVEQANAQSIQQWV